MWTTPVDSALTGPPSDPAPGSDDRTWGPRRALTALGAVGTAAAVAWGVLAPSPADRAVAVVAVLVLLAATLATVRLRPRLTAGPAGLVVRHLWATRAIRWADVVSIDVPARRRLGLTSTTLELDLVDEHLVVLGRVDLGEDPAAVADTLRPWWRPAQ